MSWEHEIVKTTRKIAGRQYDGRSRTGFYEATVKAVTPKLIVYIDALGIALEQEKLVLTSKVAGGLKEGDRVLLGGDQEYYIIDKIGG